MKYTILTLFPEMIENASKESIVGRAIEKGIIELKTLLTRQLMKRLTEEMPEGYRLYSCPRLVVSLIRRLLGSLHLMMN